jgi:hypothetical protein
MTHISLAKGRQFIRRSTLLLSTVAKMNVVSSSQGNIKFDSWGISRGCRSLGYPDAVEIWLCSKIQVGTGFVAQIWSADGECLTGHEPRDTNSASQGIQC